MSWMLLMIGGVVVVVGLVVVLANQPRKKSRH